MTESVANSSKKGMAINPEDTHCGDIAGSGATWWYNWSWNDPQNCGGDYIPMIWNDDSVNNISLLPHSEWLLGFNEPNLES